MKDHGPIYMVKVNREAWERLMKQRGWNGCRTVADVVLYFVPIRQPAPSERVRGRKQSA